VSDFWKGHVVTITVTFSVVNRMVTFVARLIAASQNNCQIGYQQSYHALISTDKQFLHHVLSSLKFVNRAF